MEKFNRDKAIKNLERKKNRNMYIKYGTFVFAICLGVFSITYIAYSKFIYVEEVPSFVNITVGSFSEHNVKVKAYLDDKYVTGSVAYLNSEDAVLSDGVYTYTYTFTDTTITGSHTSAEVECTNGVTASIENFVLTVKTSDATAKTNCSVYFKTTTTE